MLQFCPNEVGQLRTTSEETRCEMGRTIRVLSLFSHVCLIENYGNRYSIWFAGSYHNLWHMYYITGVVYIWKWDAFVFNISSRLLPQASNFSIEGKLPFWPSSSQSEWYWRHFELDAIARCTSRYSSHSVREARTLPP